jgi:hypothetical protein
MPAIVNCPKCDAQVSLPVGADPVWRVRCPLCRKDFPLAEALDTAPPVLIVLDKVRVADGGTSLGADYHAFDAEDISTLPDIEISLDNSSAEISAAVAATQSADAEDQLSRHVADDYIAVDGLSTQAMPHLTRGGYHWMGRFAGIVGGGVVGLMLGYFALLWLGGPSRDFLHLGPKLPSFILPDAFAPAVATVPSMRRDQSNGTSQHAAANGKGHRSQAEPTQTEPTSAGHKIHDPVEYVEVPGDPRDSARTFPGPDWEPPAESASAAGQPALPVQPAPWDVSQGSAFSASAIDRALTAARNARDVLAKSSLADTKARPAMGTAYRELCDLAEAITYPEAGIDSDLIYRRRRDAGKLVRQLVRTKRRELALIADYWIDSPRRSGSGIVLVGRVEDIRRIDTADVYELRIALSGKRTVTVLSSVEPPLEIDDQAVVLGSIVDQPVAGSAALHDGDQVTVQAGVIRRVLDEPTSDSA